MIYDCFLFFNELDLLDLRLHELAEVVDRFVLVEATRTHQNRKKRLFFNEHKHRYEPFLSKISHVIVDEYPGFWKTLRRQRRRPTPKDFEVESRNAIQRGLRDCQAGDTILVSDIDEIPRPAKVIEFQRVPGVKVFEQTVFNHFLNCMNVTPGYKWRGTVMVDYADFTTAQELRAVAFTASQHARSDVTLISDGGWHFSYLGDVDSLIAKIEAFSHPEVNRKRWKNRQNIADAISQGRDIFNREYQFQTVSIDHTFPAYLVSQREQFKHLIAPAPG